MMAAVSYSSNRNGGALMGVGGSDMICSNLISRLLLVSNTLFFCPFLVNVRGFSVCHFTCLDLVDRGVTVCYFTILNLV